MTTCNFQIYGFSDNVNAENSKSFIIQYLLQRFFFQSICNVLFQQYIRDSRRKQSSQIVTICNCLFRCRCCDCCLNSLILIRQVNLHRIRTILSDRKIRTVVNCGTCGFLIQSERIIQFFFSMHDQPKTNFKLLTSEPKDIDVG